MMGRLDGGKETRPLCSLMHFFCRNKFSMPLTEGLKPCENQHLALSALICLGQRDAQGRSGLVDQHDLRQVWIHSGMPVLKYLVSEIAVFGYCLEFHDVGDNGMTWLHLRSLCKPCVMGMADLPGIWSLCA